MRNLYHLTVAVIVALVTLPACATEPVAKIIPAGSNDDMPYWTKTYPAYIKNLCDTLSGEEHQYAWDTFWIAVSTDAEHAGDAAELGRLISCDLVKDYQGRNVDDSEVRLVGYTWSNTAVTSKETST